MKMPLGQCIEQHTERQLRVWLVWLDMQWDRPDRHDYYLMQIATEVKRVLSSKPRSIKMEHALLKFGGVRKKTQAPVDEKAKIAADTAISKMRLSAMFKQAGVSMDKVRKTPPTVNPPPLQDPEESGNGQPVPSP